MNALSLVLWTTLALASGGDHAGNGAGIAENNFVFAHQNIGLYLDLCFASPECGLTEEQNELARRIRASLDEEYRNPKQIGFRSERQEPGFFIIDGQLKVARTGSLVGSPIFINVDLLYRRDPNGDITPLSLETAVAVLVHELGHHHGVTDHGALDALGWRVGSMLAQRVYRTDLGPRRRHVVATVIDLDRSNSYAQLLVADGVENHDLTEGVIQVLACPEGALSGFSLFNLHWGPLKENELQLFGQLVLYCGPDRAPVEGMKVLLQLATELDSNDFLRIRKGLGQATLLK